VGSDDIVYIPLLRQIATFGLPVILSTGMASLGEIQHALEALKSSQVILLHCVSDYPTLPLRANMRRMASLSRHLVLPVGYSDHTDGIEAAVGAVWAGACIIEKHFTLDRTLAGPDHAFSADPPQWSEMVSQIRDVETMLGNGHIDPSEADAPMKVMARRSIVAARAIKAGDRFTPEALAFKRPGDGLPPFWAEFLVTRKAKRDIAADEQIKDGDWTCSC